jgi:hypothetical protein
LHARAEPLALVIEPSETSVVEFTAPPRSGREHRRAIEEAALQFQEKLNEGPE